MIRFETKSILAVPITFRQKIVGVVEVLNRIDGTPFTVEDRDFLVSLVSPAAIALENAQLFYELEESVEALDALNEVGKTLTAGIRLKEDEILELIYNQTRKLTETQDMYIALYDEATGMIRFGLALMEGQREKIKSRKAKMKQRGKTEEIIFTKQPILHKTKREAEDWYSQSEHEEFIGVIAPSWLGVPMIVGDKVLGVMAVYDQEKEHVYDEQDTQVLASMASQAAIALDNAKLYYDVNQQLERRVKGLSALYDIGQKLTSQIRASETEIIELIYEQTQALTQCEDMYIALYNDETRKIRFGLYLERGERKSIPPRPLNEKERGKTEEIVLTGQPILHKTSQDVEDWYNQPGRQRFTGTTFWPSWLGVPMMVEDKTIGVIAIYDIEEENVYDETDLEIFSAMASQAAIALDNANLFNSYASTRAELIATRQVATLGTATSALQHRINNTLNIIVPNISRLRRRVDTSDETIQEILDIIERNARSTSDYINRIQEPLKESEEDQLIDLNASLYDAQDRVQEQYQDRAGFENLDIKYNLDDSLPRIEASLGQITEVFRNLIENAYKAMGPDSGVLTITSRRTDGWLEIEIQDTGAGIPAKIQDKLFNKPVPSEQPNQGSRGSGLGLWLSALLLQKYAGEIKFSDTGPDGTTMLVRLPV